MTYTPRPVPASIDRTAQAYLADEFRKLRDALGEVELLRLSERGSEPARIDDGMIAYADGTNWNPGDGEGVYARINGAWDSLRGLQADEVETITAEWVIGGVAASNLVDKSASETISGAWTFDGVPTFTNDASGTTNSIVLAADLPSIWFNDTGGTANESDYKFYAADDNFYFYGTTDAGSSQLKIWQVINRVGVTSAEFHVTQNMTIDTDGAGPMLTLSDGAGSDGDVLLKFSTDRPWLFKQTGTGASTGLALQSQNGGKDFGIQDDAGTEFMRWNANSAGTNYAEVRSGARFRIYNSANGDYVTFQHNGTDLYTDFDNTSYWRINTTGSPDLTGVLFQRGAFMRTYDTDNSNYMTLSHNGTDGQISVEGTGFDSLRMLCNSSGACQFTIGGRGSSTLADDATYEFDFNDSAYGIWIVTNSYNDHAYAIIAHAGTAATAIYEGTSADVGLSGTNPNTDTKANYWIDGSGNLWVKNRLGSSRRFNAYHFGG